MALVSLVNAFTITAPLAKRETSQAQSAVALSHADDDTLPMPSPALPQMSPDELAQRLDRGEPLQLLDIRASERVAQGAVSLGDRKSTRLNSSHVAISYAVFCLKKKKIESTLNDITAKQLSHE